MSATAAPPTPRKSRIDDESLLKSWARVLFVWVLFALLLTAIYFLPSDLRAYTVLRRFGDPNAKGPLLWFETHPGTTEDVSISTADGPVRARLYMPRGVKHPKGMVAVHGIHHLGMDGPRLVSFAKAVAGSGLAVLTPEID